MLEILTVYCLLVFMACLAGYAPVKWLAEKVPAGERLALMPLVGAGLMALTMLWAHTALPLGGPVVLVGLAPAVWGGMVAVRDICARRFPAPKLSILVWAGLAVAASVLILMPFFLLGGATSFGIENNDAFWYTQADWRVQQFPYFSRIDQIDSTLARYPSVMQRYGLNYLSLLAQTITGLRSWQVVHLTGAFGMLLVALAAALLARRARLWWPLAMLAGVAAAGNPFLYRVYLDAFLAFPFGLAFLLAVCWLLASPVVTGESNRHLLLLSLLFAAGIVFYMDLTPIVAVVSVVFIMFARKADFTRLGMLSLAAMAALALAAPMALVLPSYLGMISGAPNFGTYFEFSNWPAGVCYLAGTMNLYDMLRGTRPGIWDLAGGAAALMLLAHAAWQLRSRWREIRVPWLYAAPLAVVFVYLLFVKNNQYTSHRIYVMLAAVAPMLVLGCFGRNGFLRRWRRTALLFTGVAFGTIGAVHSDVSLLAFVRGSWIHVTPLEKEIGDSWIPGLPKGSRILIDAGNDNRIFYPHYMYWESLYGAGFDERRVIFPQHRYAYITPSTPLEDLDLKGCTHVLRRRDAPRIAGDFKLVRSNARYELLVIAKLPKPRLSVLPPSLPRSRWPPTSAVIGPQPPCGAFSTANPPNHSLPNWIASPAETPRRCPRS